MLVTSSALMAIRAVSKTASKIIEEVRRQFRENPGIMKGTAKPDYAKAVDITARAALRGMIAPGYAAGFGSYYPRCSLSAISPRPAGYDAAMVSRCRFDGRHYRGILMASFMNNGGGAWDNAKKYIEDKSTQR
jgi:K(+)-stimulated pyrophosphate-energized sodium pump